MICWRWWRRCCETVNAVAMGTIIGQRTQETGLTITELAVRKRKALLEVQAGGQATSSCTQNVGTRMNLTQFTTTKGSADSEVSLNSGWSMRQSPCVGTNTSGPQIFRDRVHRTYGGVEGEEEVEDELLKVVEDGLLEVVVKEEEDGLVEEEDDDLLEVVVKEEEEKASCWRW